MNTIRERFLELGIGIPQLSIPGSDVDLYRWAVIACDQHTSEPDYWEEAAGIVGDAPSALRLILPEVYLGRDDVADREKATREAMEAYIRNDVIRELEPGFVLSVRSTPHVSSRQGLILALDLEKYDFRPGARELIRSTERTIEDRLPARVRIRDGASLEIPHVLVLIDDPDDHVFGAIGACDPPQIYSTELMLGGGSVSGYHLTGPDLEPVLNAFEKLRAASSSDKPILFAVGDGNHSLAAAKRVWETAKHSVGPDHPYRFAAVEVLNLYDPGLRFEPIHRLVSVTDPFDWVTRFSTAISGTVETMPIKQIRKEIGKRKGRVGFVAGSESGIIRLGSTRDLPVSVVQDYINGQQGLEVDYLHGWDTSIQLGGRRNSVTLLMPPFDAGMLFPTVAKKGVLPRKAFSLGEAEEKRYYLESRRLS